MSDIVALAKNVARDVDYRFALEFALESDVVNEGYQREHTSASLATLFGALVLMLAAIGIYGVVSYSVAQRTREFGMRMALGATSGDLLRLVLGAVLRLSLIGIGTGIPCAWIVSKVASRLFFDIRLADFAGFAIVPFIIAAIATVSGLLPARRAARLDPMEALRYK